MIKIVLEKKNEKKTYIKYIMIYKYKKKLIILGNINTKICKISLNLNIFTFWIAKNAIIKSFLLYKIIKNNCNFLINIYQKYEKIKY